MKPRWLGVINFDIVRYFAFAQLSLNVLFAFVMLCLPRLGRSEPSWSIRTYASQLPVRPRFCMYPVSAVHVVMSKAGWFDWVV